MKLVATLIASLFAVSAFAQTKSEPVHVKTTPNPVVAPAPAASAPTKKEEKKKEEKKAEAPKAAEPAKK